MSEIVLARGKAPWLWPDFTFELTANGKEHGRNLKILHAVTNKMIRERLRELPERLGEGEGNMTIGGKQKRIAFLDLLLQMHREDKSFTLEDIREEVDTFMFEGHDTTAAAVSWAILQIGLYPDIQARLHEEIDDVFGKSDRPVTADDLSKLSYLNCVVKEALRLMPSVPMIFRQLADDIELDGKVVPKEVLIMLQIYGLHRDPEHFPDPEKFDPDRFLPENSAKRHPYAYIPFSAGPRNCIGQKFALMEDKVILTNILRQFAIESVQTVDEAKPAGQLIVRPVEGSLYVKFTSRK